MHARDDSADDLVGLLTQRERECLRLVDQHLSSKQIARELGMSKTSVDTYCDRARRKLGVEDRYAAARLARQLDAEGALASTVNHVLTGSGHDTIRTDAPPEPWPDDPATEGALHGRLAELRQPRGDRAGPAPASGDRRVRGPLAGSGGAGGSPSDLLLGAIGTPTRGFGGDAGPGGHGQAFGLRYAEAGAVQAYGNGLAGNPLHD